MKDLLEDYKRRVTTAETMLKGFKSNGSEHDIRKQERLTTKASEYRTIVAEIERVINSHENAIQQMVELGLIKKVEPKNVADVIRRIPQQKQVQYDLTRQLRELRYAANQLGLYDASDYLIRKLEEMKSTLCTCNTPNPDTFGEKCKNCYKELR